MAVLGGVAAGAAWATAGMGAAEVTNAMRVHKEAYMQDKRFFYAQHTEAVAHHGEVYAQAERHHAQSYAQGEGRYYQPDKQHRRTFEQARLQHTLDRDIAMRAEIRDGLRDEFDQKNNRQNALMVSQAVMLTCALQLGIVPELPSDAGGAAQWAGLTFAYSALLGVSGVLLTISLWFNFVVTRRLNQYTAGVMHVEMQLDESWRERRGVDDVRDAALLRDHFRKWFGTQCGFVADVSQFSFAFGVIALFCAACILIHMRFELLSGLSGAGAPFVGALCVASVSIVAIEVQERRRAKRKDGVYARPWVGRLTSSLRDQMTSLFTFEGNALAPEGVDEEQAMEQSGRSESRARRHCPPAAAVAQTAGVAAKAAHTERVLEKAWRMYQEHEQREKQTKQREEWQRDEITSRVLTECQQLVRDRRAAERHLSEPDDAKASAGGGGSSDDGSAGAEESLASEATTAAPLRVVHVAGEDAVGLRTKLGEYFRSTMVHVTNATDVALQLRTHRIVSGAWFDGCTPPTVIPPQTEVVFASTSRSKWVGGTEVELSYDASDHEGPQAVFRLRWVNGILAGDRGRYCEAVVESAGEAGAPTDTFFVAKDDDDQTENSEVYFTITSQHAAEEHASRFGEGSYIQPRTGSSAAVEEAVMAGTLEKRRPDGLGLLWQRRFFRLTPRTLCYFRSDADTRAHAQLGQLELADVIAVQIDAGSAEFVVGAPPAHLGLPLYLQQLTCARRVQYWPTRSARRTRSRRSRPTMRWSGWARSGSTARASTRKLFLECFRCRT